MACTIEIVDHINSCIYSESIDQYLSPILSEHINSLFWPEFGFLLLRHKTRRLGKARNRNIYIPYNAENNATKLSLWDNDN